MTRPDLDADQAVKALTFRLRDWGVDEPGTKARAFIDDLQARGWRVAADAPTRRPPHKHEECAKHAGEYRLSCRGCRADRLAEAEGVLAYARPAMNREQALKQARKALAEARQQTAQRDAARVAVEEEA